MTSIISRKSGDNNLSEFTNLISAVEFSRTTINVNLEAISLYTSTVKPAVVSA